MRYIDFLQYCLDEHRELPVSAKSIDWSKLLIWAEQQAIVGVVFGGIQRAGKSLEIPTDILFKWIGYANQIEQRNKLLNKRCVELTELLAHRGFDTCILKGQGNALLYDGRSKKEDGRSLALLRTPGDIDVWVRPGERLRIRELIRFAREKNPKGKICYHHVDYGEYKGVEVEIHYRPSFMFNPIHNYRLQKWFKDHGEGFMVELPEGVGNITVPNKEFNIVFQLSHIYNHLLHEGIGLRQIIDYYFLLKANKELEEVRGSYRSAQEVKRQYYETLRYLGLKQIAGAVMWVLGYLVHGEGFMVHGLKMDEWMICEPDERRGKVLLAEIMKGGNFGQSDLENQKATTAIQKNILRIKRDLRMMRYFPSECLWEPVFRTWHFFWRMMNG